MSLISQLVHQALSTGYLGIESENKLRALLTESYGKDDFYAFRKLQDAVMRGSVRQESRELLLSGQS